MDDLIGKSVGPYKILAKIGAGGMADVYKGYQESLGRHVAIKVLRGELARDEEFVARFRREALAVAQFDHPNILHVHDAGMDHGVYYLAMTFVQGGSLKELIAQGPLPVEQAVSIGAQLADALDYAHRRGIIHRDVKPGNVLLSEGRPVLTDFGIAKALYESAALTRTGAAIGTPEYMAPEQIQGQPVDARTDLYALGIVIYEMLTGWAPFSAPTPMATLYRQMNEPPAPLRQANVGAPDWLEGVVNKALAKRPDTRYQQASELAQALRAGGTVQAVAAEVKAVPATARAASPAGQTPSPPAAARRAVARPTPSRLPWLLGGVAALLLVALLIGLAVILGGGGEQAAATPSLLVAVTPAVTRMPEPATTLPPPTDKSPPAAISSRSAAAGTRTPMRPTDTPQPTATPAPPTVTRIPPTATLKPKPLQAGATQTRAKDGAVMVYVPAGQFLMGSTVADGQATGDEKPQHKVTLDAFWIDKTEVTNARYKQCVEAGTCRVPTHRDYGQPTYGDTSKANHPVGCVSQDDARAYCEWAGARLPTEAEWEKAARGTDGRIYPWGNDFDCHKGSFDDEQVADDYVVPGGPNCDGYAQTAPVGSYPAGASPYGVLDMAGNVWEWVTDWYSDSYYASSPAGNPRGPDSGQYRVVRGGSWHGGWHLSRAANRLNGDPPARSSVIGFRCGAAAP